MEIAFEEKVVAFIDVLGFKSLVDSATEDSVKLSELSNLINNLSTCSTKLNDELTAQIPSQYYPTTTYISDCIITSVPLVKDSNSHWGINVMALRVRELTHILLHAGYLVRGGIGVGSVFHENGNIIGPAYQQAFEKEQEQGNASVKLSATMINALKQSKYAKGELFIHDGDEVYINSISDDGHIRNYLKISDPNNLYRHYLNNVDRNINILQGKERSKWEWFKDNLLMREINELNLVLNSR